MTMVTAAPNIGMAATLTPEHQQLIDAADPQRVAKKANKCAKCHGDGGISDDPEMPHLVGQPASYLLKQLQDFRNDAREGGRMNKAAKRLSDQDMADLAVHFAATELPPNASAPAPAEPTLVSTGDAARNIKACSDCHAADGKGKNDKHDAPALRGMTYDYFVMSMQSFRDGSRANDTDALMRNAAKPLSDAEISELATYYLALGQRKRVSP